MALSVGDARSKKFRLLFGTQIKKALPRTKKLQKRLQSTVDLLLAKYPSIKDQEDGTSGPFSFETVCTAMIMNKEE